MNIFKRLFKIGQAEAHAAVDHLENPIKLTEQGIRDMKEDLDKSLHALAEVKAMQIRAKNEEVKEIERSKEYENKAMLLLQKAQKGDLDIVEADRLATEALVKKEEAIQQAARAKAEREKFDGNISQLEQNIRSIRHNISKWENELKTLKARVKVSAATEKLNKQMAQIDGSDTIAMLERMRDKVAESEALAEAYGEIADESRSVDDEIDKALEGSEKTAATDALAALKEKMGLNS
ncbi:MAG: PspA/IM30 family protein [Flavobacteriales bacterium]|nr:PspA/IM30 family protein [Flavobacteriales bacterium]